jgi:hypothetical protein
MIIACTSLSAFADPTILLQPGETYKVRGQNVKCDQQEVKKDICTIQFYGDKYSTESSYVVYFNDKQIQAFTGKVYNYSSTSQKANDYCLELDKLGRCECRF